MTLSASLYMGSAAIQANQLALQVIGNNITNASTPGFVREEVQLSPIMPGRIGSLTVGNGVTVGGVVAKVDQFLSERARAADGQYQAADAKSTYLNRLQNLFGELSDNDLSTQFNNFIASLQDVQNRPDDPSLRSVAVQRGALVADTIQSLRAKIDGLRTDASNEVKTSVDQINNSVDKIRQLNAQIVALESAGGQSAGSLRNIRDQELAKITSKIDVQVIEQPSGSINIYSGSDYLLFDGQTQKVEAQQSIDRGQYIQTLVFADSRAPVSTKGGRLGGVQDARDNEIAGVSDALDQLAASLIFEFNKLHSSGQGLQNFTQVTSTNNVLVPTGQTAPLNSTTPPTSGLPFLPQNGSFELRATNKVTGQVTTSVINVDLDGLGADDSLNSVVAKINAAPPAGLGAGAASVTSQGYLQITAPANVEFSFGDDTSGFLAAMGINTFFTGQDSRTIGVNDVLKSNGAFLAVSQNNVSGDTQNLTNLIQFKDQSLNALGGGSFSDAITGLVADLGTFGENAQAQADAAKTTKQALESENLSISGVSLDEETVKLISFQRSFQASARYIATVNQLLDAVINLGR